MSKASKQQQRQKTITGIVKCHPDGFGFLIPDDSDEVDVYMPRNEMSGVMSSDRLSVRIIREKGSKRLRGELDQIVARNVKKVTGKFESMPGGKGVLRDKSFAWGADLVAMNPK